MFEKAGLEAISIHAPREGSDTWQWNYTTSTTISIHAPREGSDQVYFMDSKRESAISIHAPREGSDARLGGDVIPGSLFQSTLPVRGATANLSK